MRRSRITRTTVALSAAVVLLAGCGSAPEVGLPADAEAPVCSWAHWPERVSNLDRVSTNPESPAVAAWGSPSIIARCGLAPLAPTTDECVTVNGVDWVVTALADGSSATTYGRDPAIEVLVPVQYGVVTMLLPLFEGVAKSLPSTGRHCS